MKSKELKKLDKEIFWLKFKLKIFPYAFAFIVIGNLSIELIMIYLKKDNSLKINPKNVIIKNIEYLKDNRLRFKVFYKMGNCVLGLTVMDFASNTLSLNVLVEWENYYELFYEKN